MLYVNMNSILDKLYINCKQIKNQEELEEYKEKGRKLRELPLRGNTHISGLVFRPKKWVSDDSEDVYVNHFDEHGNQQEFVKDYIITRTGQVYYIDNDGSPKPMSLDKTGCFTLSLKKPDENGKKKIRPRQTLLQCASYLANYDDWDVVMQNRGKTGDAQVDHVLQENEPNVDIQCLDLVTCAENLNRKCLDLKNKETNQKSGKNRGKPFTITIQEVSKDDIVLNASYVTDGEALLEQQGITIGRMTISNYLNGKFKKDYMQSKKTQQRKVIFKYTEEFLEDQKDLPGEIWRTKEEWDRVEEIIKIFENKKYVGAPKAISNFGRIKTNYDKVTYGNYKSGVHKYNGARVHRLVGLAFNDHPENDPKRQGYTPENTVVRHINEHELKERGIDVEKKYRIDEKKRKVLSNHIDTLEFGTIADNNKDRSNHNIHKDQQIPMNEFSVTPLRNDLPEFNRTFHSVSEFLKFVEEQNIDITFHSSNVNKALRGEYTHHRHYKFSYVKTQ